MIDYCLFHPNAIVFYIVAFAATQSGKWQIGKFRCPLLGCLDFPENNEHADHGLAFGEAVVNQKDGSKNNLEIEKGNLAIHNSCLYNL